MSAVTPFGGGTATTPSWGGGGIAPGPTAAGAGNQVVIDTAGVEGGNVFTTYEGAIDAALAIINDPINTGRVDVIVRSDVTSAGGNAYDAGLEQIDIRSDDATVLRTITFGAGCSTHGRPFGSVLSLELATAVGGDSPFDFATGTYTWVAERMGIAVPATAPPLVLLDTGTLMLFSVATFDAETNVDDVWLELDAAATNSLITFGLVTPTPQSTQVGASFASDTISGPRGSVGPAPATNFLTFLDNSANSGGAMPTFTMATSFSGAVRFGKTSGAAYFLSASNATEEIFRPDVVIAVDGSVTSTLNINVSEPVTQLEGLFATTGTYFEIILDSPDPADIVEVALVGGDTFEGGGASRSITGQCQYRLLYNGGGGSGTWSLVGPHGTELTEFGDYVRRKRVQTDDDTANVVLYSRELSTDTAVRAIAEVTAAGGSSADIAVYGVVVRAQNDAGVATVSANAFYTSDATVGAGAWFVGWAINGTALELQVTGGAGQTINWTADIQIIESPLSS